MRKRIGLAFLAAFFIASSARSAVYTQDTLPSLIKRAAVWEAELSENQIRTTLDGVSEGFVVVDARLETRNNFNIYQEHLHFSSSEDAALGAGRDWSLATVQKPPTLQFLDPVSKQIKEGYRGEANFRLRLALPPGGVRSLGPDHKIALLVDFQACNTELCLLPATLKLEIPLARTVKSAFSENPETAADRGLLERSAAALKKSLESDSVSLLSFLLLFVAGLITAFTPCVYPLYPITLGIFSRWSSKNSSKAFVLALSYCAGMTLSYAALGLLTASTGSLFGSLTQNPVFLLGVGGLILLSAIFLSGLLPFEAPRFLQNVFTRPESANTESLGTTRLALKAAGMGLGLGIVAAPCVGPVIIALMAWLGTRFSSGDASYLYGFFLLAAFGAGMSLPFLVLAQLVAGAQSLPRLGRFTPYFKNLGTGLMIAGSLFFIVPGLKLAGALRHEGVVRKFRAYSLSDWSQAKWSVVDFRADWCAACLELEHETFTNYRVSPLFEKGIWDFVSVDLTANSPENRRTAGDWNVIGLPSVFVVAPGGRTCADFTLTGFEDPQTFLKRLADAQRQCMK